MSIAKDQSFFVKLFPQSRLQDDDLRACLSKGLCVYGMEKTAQVWSLPAHPEEVSRLLPATFHLCALSCMDRPHLCELQLHKKCMFVLLGYGITFRLLSAARRGHL